MKAVVVYESHWGNTAAIARAIAHGFGPGAQALATDEALGPSIQDADLIVAGAPVMAFRLPTDRVLEGVGSDPGKAPTPDLSHPSLRSWLEALPKGTGRSVAFETRLWWSPGGATGAIERGLTAAGYPPLAKARRFIVKGGTGPLREGELDRALTWGSELRDALEDGPNGTGDPA